MADEAPRSSPTDSRLLLDVMLGKLASYLRMCGYDAAYALDRDAEADDRLLALASEENRRLLTRDHQLARRADRDTAAGSVLLQTRDVTDQLRELREAGFTLELDSEPARCGRCNGPVAELADHDERPAYAPDTTQDGDPMRVWRCRDCGQCFWKGSHWTRVSETLSGL
ncbi:Mut7-C RNAse domain-containing protein [Salinirubrum litoreum]|uniref:Mut7-C RNAse domain-containing protein n=1 Tax=Salinirubrum litoreum TaxID=1126234 RepID=A0ABD5RAR8_9EURY|nr:Mut7-C RNAse domain-containing protein [Salinirubrum litoreum]